MSFRRRNYPEVVDNLLTAVLGGVAGESHPFPPPPSAQGASPVHVLEQPQVRQVVSVYGTRNGESRLFRNGADFELLSDGQTLRWKNGAELPDEGTLLHVNYLREDDPPLLTDMQVGSVVRTLAESVALEIARLYAQLQAVYESSYIDTASGSALDKVVALLGVERIRAGRPSTKVRFTRAASTPGNITIPAGTRIIDARARIEYETTETVTLAQNQAAISVAARDLEAANDPVDANVLTVLPVPIAGIREVNNPAPSARGANDETDAELRTRAKNFLHGSERATLGALQQSLARQQVRADLEEVAGSPGVIRVTPHSADLPPERRAQLLADLQATRPAGVSLLLEPTRVPAAVDLEIVLTTTPRSPEADLRRAHTAVRDKIAEYFSRLPVRENASLNRIVGLVLSTPGVEDVRVLSAAVRTFVNGTENVSDRLNEAAGVIDLANEPTVLGELSISDPNLPTTVDVTLRFPKAASAPDPGAIESALSGVLAYWNTLASTPPGTDPAESARRTLRLGKLLRVIPLPGKPGESQQSFDSAAFPPALPTLASVAPYGVVVLLHQAQGLTKVLSEDSASYEISLQERLLLNALNVIPE